MLPINVKKFEANDDFYRGVLFSLPLVGLLLSLILIGLFYILPLPMLYKSLFCAIFYLVSYGFLHLEAVCDTIDGYFASLSKKDVHTIMHEPQVGAIGAIGGFCFIVLKISALAYLLYFEHYIAIVCAIVFSRFSLFFALDLKYHKDSHFIQSIQKSFHTPFLIKLLFLPFSLLTKIILTLIKKKIGFLNGDTLGFNIEIQEIIYLNIAIMLLI